MDFWGQWGAALWVAHREITLFAVVGLIIGGIDDILIDVTFIVRTLWRRIFIYRHHQRMTSDRLPPANECRFAIFIPAWDEAEVIAGTLRDMLARWSQPLRIFVGVYPNDPATTAQIARVASEDDRVHLVIHSDAGPTTKADCLNRLWHAMLRDEAARGQPYSMIVLQDAEDIVHPDALRLFGALGHRFDMIQLPVRPLLDDGFSWIAGHYADEFAESHAKFIGVREAVGAAVPSAGVGCALSRPILQKIADARNGAPFDATSLTEDYELGLHVAQLRGKAAFVRMRDASGNLICTQEHFPETLDAAVRQKARWTIGIALAGWDRMGWRGGLREHWMRLHDRRALLSALVLLAAYFSVLGYGVILIAGPLLGVAPPQQPAWMVSALAFTGTIMSWRLILRAAFTTHAYGWRQGLIAIPRSIVANVIALLAARRAITIYAGYLKGRNLAWDKTAHRRPPDSGNRS